MDRPKPEVMTDEEHAAYKVVYQGGHHDVLCNGESHITRGGGWVGLNKSKYIMRRGRCDCARWQAFWAELKPPSE